MKICELCGDGSAFCIADSAETPCSVAIKGHELKALRKVAVAANTYRNTTCVEASQNRTELGEALAALDKLDTQKPTPP